MSRLGPPLPRRVPTLVLTVALAVTTAACGGAAPSTDRPSAQAQACRGTWKDLATQVHGRDEQTNPSALAPRWNTIVATIDYYETSATGARCDEALRRQKAAIGALSAFSTRVAAYDMELRLASVREAAQAYAGRPRPAPSARPSAKPGAKRKHPAPPPPPAPATVAAALRVVVGQAPVATQQQGPGWEEARVVELSDAAAVAKAVKDLAFLSSQSPAYRACTVALARIKAALAAAG